MAKEVVMPALGMAQETGTLLKWLKAPGEQVRKGELLMEIETDKAVVEVEAMADGVLAHVGAQAGDVIPVGQPIAVLLAPGESADSVPAPTAKISPLPTQPASVHAAPARGLAPAVGQPTGAPLEASPLARRLAAEHGLALELLKPQGGKVQKEDVLAYLAARQAPVGSGLEEAVMAGDDKVAPQQGAGVEPLGRLWRIMAERVTQAWTTVPHFYLMREVDATGLVSGLAAARQRYSAQITYTDLVVKLVAAALRQHPRLNAAWQPPGILLHSEIHIGLAVAVEQGLVVPVVHRADGLSLDAIAARRTELVARAQAGKLTPDDISGGTFTITNLGMYGVDAFTAIINPPQAAILAVGRIADRVVAMNGEPAVRPMLSLSLGCDHRVADGARGAEFLHTLAALMEDPRALLA